MRTAKILSTTFLAIAGALISGNDQASAQICNWMTAASYYTHDENTMQRVNQYAPDPKVIHTPDPTVSVYRHQRSTLSVDGSMDQYHKVYRCGDPVRPYGEWKYPYRPYSVPFSDWAYGSPFGHLASPLRTNPMLPPTFLVPGNYGGYGYPYPTPYPTPPSPTPYPYSGPGSGGGVPGYPNSTGVPAPGSIPGSAPGATIGVPSPGTPYPGVSVE